MAVTDTWTAPIAAGALDLTTGGTIEEAWLDAMVSNVQYLGKRQFAEFTNRIGVASAVGDVLIQDPANASSVKGTTAHADPTVVGVALEAIANLSVVKVATLGIATVKVAAATAIGNYLSASTTTVNAIPSASRTPGTFAVALTSSGGAGTVQALLLGPGAAATPGRATKIVSAYVATLADRVLRVDASAGSVTVTLPPIATTPDGFELVVKKVDTTVIYSVTVDGNAAETIDGELTQVLDTYGESMTFVKHATGWDVV